MTRAIAAIRTGVPGAAESISYGIPTFKVGGRAVIYCAAFSEHYSVYPATAALIEALGDALAGADYNGKGTMRLMNGSTLATWRGIAKDGMDLPSERRVDAAAEIRIGNGASYDFEFIPAREGDLRLDIAAGNGQLLLGVPVAVR